MPEKGPSSCLKIAKKRPQLVTEERLGVCTPKLCDKNPFAKSPFWDRLIIPSRPPWVRFWRDHTAEKQPESHRRRESRGVEIHWRITLVAPPTGWMLYYLCFNPSTAKGPPPCDRECDWEALSRPLSRIQAQAGALNRLVLNHLGSSTARLWCYSV